MIVNIIIVKLKLEMDAYIDAKAVHDAGVDAEADRRP